jgi:hypothetical protein
MLKKLPHKNHPKFIPFLARYPKMCGTVSEVIIRLVIDAISLIGSSLTLIMEKETFSGVSGTTDNATK